MPVNSKPKRGRPRKPPQPDAQAEEQRTAETVATADTPQLPNGDATPAGSLPAPVADSSQPGQAFYHSVRSAQPVDSLRASSAILRELWDQWTHAAELATENENTEDTARLKALMTGRDRLGETLVQALANHVRIQERHGELQASSVNKARAAADPKTHNTFTVDNIFVQMQGVTGEPVQKFLPDLRRNLERLMTRSEKQTAQDLKRDAEYRDAEEVDE